jgi:hypothetical protein
MDNETSHVNLLVTKDMETLADVWRAGIVLTDKDIHTLQLVCVGGWYIPAVLSGPRERRTETCAEFARVFCSSSHASFAVSARFTIGCDGRGVMRQTKIWTSEKAAQVPGQALRPWKA